IYEKARQNQPDCDDVLLYNERGELTETTIANLVVELNDQLYTPSISCGLLGGTFRSHLLKQGKIQEKVLTPDDLTRATNLFLINSVRGWQKAQME
ncbi:MAG: aminotransferase class IV, partial [Chloroflexi bacterium]|nr:aminotransferase class IV [Chloroflexota bacterium]